MDSFTTDNLATLCAERGLFFPRSMLGQLVTALKVGKHVALTGPPGTGKTTLAYLTAELARHALLCSGSVGVTASQEWDTSVTIGRYHNSREGVVFEAGVFLASIQKGHWLVIDELNRADFDRAFGPLFTVLAGQPVTLPFKLPGHELPLAIVPPDAEQSDDVEAIRVPGSWRMIATMNAFDKDLLYRLSHALMRRFAFIEVATPDDDVIRDLLPAGADAVAELLPIREFVDLGPAVFIDAGRFAAARSLDVSVSRSRLLYEIFTSYFAPQLDTLTEEQGMALLARLAPCFDGEELDLVDRAITTLFAPAGRSAAAAPPLAAVPAAR